MSMSSPIPPTSPSTIERLRELCIRLEAGQDVEYQAIRFIKDTHAKLRADPDLEFEVNALLSLLTSRLYTRITHSYLHEAMKADDEASWWSFLEQSSNSELAWYLLQTLPHRIYRLSTALRERTGQNTGFTLLATFFPHLSLRKVRYLPLSPFHYLRNECSAHREALEILRDDTAERLGKLVSLQSTYSQSNLGSSLPALFAMTNNRLAEVDSVQNEEFIPACQTSSEVLQALGYLSQKLTAQKNTFASVLTPHLKPSILTLTWPKFILVPSITFFLFRMIYTSGSSNISTYSMLKTTFFQIQSTATGFWKNYLLEPLREIFDTMRTGENESTRLVNPHGVQADVESLHRMAISLTQDKYKGLSYPPQAHTSALDELTAQILSGDLTPVLKIYENDLRSPLRSALTGSLLRSLLVQVQRMKVDLSTTLQSLDKLLHSQALTFALVGVAPSLVITYALISALRTFIIGANRRARFGGRGTKRGVWSAMRRIERILLYSATMPHTISQNPQDIMNAAYDSQNTLPPLSQGLLLISLSHLRTFAHLHLPLHSSLGSKTQSAHNDRQLGSVSAPHTQKHGHSTEQNMRAAFLSDIDDLSNPALGRDAKLRVVDRMWRSWGVILGWGEVGGGI